MFQLLFDGLKYVKEKMLGNYYDLYNIQDVVLLADVFENFRNICVKNYKLDPAHYFFCLFRLSIISISNAKANKNYS